MLHLLLKMVFVCTEKEHFLSLTNLTGNVVLQSSKLVCRSSWYCDIKSNEQHQYDAEI